MTQIDIKKARKLLFLFGLFKIPMIAICRPRLISLSNQSIIIRIGLSIFTRNHLKSMYFGAMCVGADLAAGFHGFFLGRQSGHTISLAFKDFKANFIKRPEGAVYFVCHEGYSVSQQIQESIQTGERITKPIVVDAYMYYNTPKQEKVAEFVLGLSIKAK